VGKLDKKQLRSEHSDNQLTIEVCRD
jgi:hypothetical protein